MASHLQPTPRAAAMVAMACWDKVRAAGAWAATAAKPPVVALFRAPAEAGVWAGTAVIRAARAVVVAVAQTSLTLGNRVLGPSAVQVVARPAATVAMVHLHRPAAWMHQEWEAVEVEAAAR